MKAQAKQLKKLKEKQKETLKTINDFYEQAVYNDYQMGYNRGRLDAIREILIALTPES
jgi:hypothetical protein